MQDGSVNATLRGANLSCAAQTGRLRVGIVFLGIALVAGLTMVEVAVPWPIRLLLFVPFFLAAFGAFQGLYRTCPKHALLKTREVDSGEALPVANRGDALRAKGLARKVWLLSFGSASVATLFFAVLP